MRNEARQRDRRAKFLEDARAFVMDEGSHAEMLEKFQKLQNGIDIDFVGKVCNGDDVDLCSKVVDKCMPHDSHDMEAFLEKHPFKHVSLRNTLLAIPEFGSPQHEKAGKIVDCALLDHCLNLAKLRWAMGGVGGTCRQESAQRAERAGMAANVCDYPGKIQIRRCDRDDKKCT